MPTTGSSISLAIVTLGYVDSSNCMTLSEDVDVDTKRVEKEIREWWTIYRFIYNPTIRTIDDCVQSVPMNRRRYSMSYY